MKSSSEATIDHPVEGIDLTAWLSNMTDRDYQACSRGHRAAGTFREGSSIGMVNVENVGGNLLVQHYLMVKAQPEQVVMHSTKTRVYILHLVPATIEVIWTVEVEPKTNKSATFRCTVETRMSTLLGALSNFILLQLFLQRHTREETVKFAGDIQRKAGLTSQAGAELVINRVEA